MTELYLIVHKVRGEPAFDVAINIGDETGDLWIIPTSGHRAYPAAYWELSAFVLGGQKVIDDLLGLDLSRLPDHYPAPQAVAPAQRASGSIAAPTPEDL